MEVKDEVQLTLTVIGMFVGPWLAVRLSLRQFRTQKWWERQQDAYTIILESLSVLHFHFDNLHDAWSRKEEWQPTDDSYEKIQHAGVQLEMHSATGEFLISKIAAEALGEYQRHAKFGRSLIGVEYASQFRDAAAKCIEVVKAEAKKQLKTAR